MAEEDEEGTALRLKAMDRSQPRTNLIKAGAWRKYLTAAMQIARKNIFKPRDKFAKRRTKPPTRRRRRLQSRGRSNDADGYGGSGRGEDVGWGVVKKWIRYGNSDVWGGWEIFLEEIFRFFEIIFDFLGNWYVYVRWSLTRFGSEVT